MDLYERIDDPIKGTITFKLHVDNNPVIGVNLQVPYLSQLSATAAYAKGDCGSACIAMMLNFHGKSLTVDDVSRATGLPAGFLLLSLPQLIATALKLGLALAPKSNRNLEDIKAELRLSHPLILLINYSMLPNKNKHDIAYTHGHFIVGTGYDEAGLIYNDPYWLGSAGEGLHLAWSDFDRAWGTANQDFSILRQMLTEVH